MQLTKRSWITAGILAVILVIVMVFHNGLSGSYLLPISKAITPITLGFGLLMVLVVLLLSFTKFGSIRIGGVNSRTEYSTASWISMLFTAGMGIGLLFYSSESLMHFHSNPFSKDINTGYALALYDWTIIPWSIYVVVGIIMAYSHFNKGTKLRFSSVLGLSGASADAVDIVIALSIVAGLTTSLGLGIGQLQSGIKYVFSSEVNSIILVLVIEAIALWSVGTGIKRGMKWLSNGTMIIAALLLTHLFLNGMNSGLEYSEFIGGGVGDFVGNFINYSLPYPEYREWQASWSVFYILWYTSWAAFVGAFLAKISKGRTIRELAIGGVLVPTVLTVLWFGIFTVTDYSLDANLYPIISRDITKSLFALLGMITPPYFYEFISAVVMVLIALFFITSADSGSFIVASTLSDGKVTGVSKVFWIVVQCIVVIVLMSFGGLQCIQSASVLMGTVMMIVIVIGLYKFIKLMKYEYNNRGKI